MSIEKIGSLIKTQDNRYTDQPIFVIEERELVITDPDYGYDDSNWVNTESGNYEEADETRTRRLDALNDGDRDTGDWKKFHYKETWKFVTSCFTEEGCNDYLKINGHNLRKTRIYAYGSFRNTEYQAIRNCLVNMGADLTALLSEDGDGYNLYQGDNKVGYLNNIDFAKSVLINFE